MHMPLEDTLGLNLLAANQHQAEHNREHFDDWKLLCLNVMSAPWSSSPPASPWRCWRAT
jgi:hydrogenase nickel incorporation protein HypB